jgi:hypothetical protein
MGLDRSLDRLSMGPDGVDRASMGLDKGLDRDSMGRWASIEPRRPSIGASLGPRWGSIKPRWISRGFDNASMGLDKNLSR